MTAEATSKVLLIALQLVIYGVGIGFLLGVMFDFWNRPRRPAPPTRAPKVSAPLPPGPEKKGGDK